jgi:ABC-type nitrate/sulfonate/bicarbonate transport system substrate-binding protein
MFEDANLNINVYPQGNGPSVWGLLSNGEADIAFLGAPPMTIKSMNAQAIGVPNA